MIHFSRSLLGLAALGQPWGPGPGQPQGAASTDCAMFWSRMDASGCGFCDSPAVSKPGAGERPAVRAGSEWAGGWK